MCAFLCDVRLVGRGADRILGCKSVVGEGMAPLTPNIPLGGTLRTVKRLLVLLVAVVFALTACSSATATSVSPSAFADLTEQPSVVVLDVRTPGEFAQGHLPDAINMDVESPAFASQIATLDTGATYAVYCRSGNRSKTAMDQMKAAGFTNVTDLDGGIVAWQAQGLPVVG